MFFLNAISEFPLALGSESCEKGNVCSMISNENIILSDPGLLSRPACVQSSPVDIPHDKGNLAVTHPHHFIRHGSPLFIIEARMSSFYWIEFINPGPGQKLTRQM